MKKRTSQGEIAQTFLVKGVDGVRALLEQFPGAKATFRKVIDSFPEGDDNRAKLEELFTELYPESVFTPDTYDAEVFCTTKDILDLCPESWGVTQPNVSQMTTIFGLSEVGKVRLTAKGGGSHLYDRATVEAMIEAIASIRERSQAPKLEVVTPDNDNQEAEAA